MSISTKLIELNDAKQDIKDAIETKGVPLTGIPFTQYSEKILEISGGGAPEAPKPSDAFPIDDILAANVDSAGEYRVLMFLRTDELSYNIVPFDDTTGGRLSKIKTSDGDIYTTGTDQFGRFIWSTSTSHTWDPNEDLVDDNGEKYRWIIYYFISTSTLRANNTGIYTHFWRNVMGIVTDGYTMKFSGGIIQETGFRKILSFLIHKNPESIGNEQSGFLKSNFSDSIIEYPTIIGSPSSYVRYHNLDYAKNQKIDTIYMANFNTQISVYNENIISIRNLVPESTASNAGAPRHGSGGYVNSTLESVGGTPTRGFLLGLKGNYATQVIFKGQGLDITGFVPNSFEHATDISALYSLTRASLLSLINALSTTTTSVLTLGPQHIAKLSAEELQSIIDKGWSYA